MANTYTQPANHVVIAVKNRQALIGTAWSQSLHQYMCGIMNGQGAKPLGINSMPDHLHILFEMKPEHRLSDLMRELKSESSRWINEKKKAGFHFQWQEGYSGFAVCRRHVKVVATYISNQQEHHHKKTFQEELLELYKEAEIDFNPLYIFKPPE